MTSYILEKGVLMDLFLWWRYGKLPVLSIVTDSDGFANWCDGLALKPKSIGDTARLLTDLDAPLYPRSDCVLTIWRLLKQIRDVDR